MGRYHRTLEPGMNVLVPIIDKVGWMLQSIKRLILALHQVRYVQSLKEIAIDIPSQQAVTSGLHLGMEENKHGSSSSLSYLRNQLSVCMMTHCVYSWTKLSFFFCFLSPPPLSDNVPVHIDGVLFLTITDTYKASYEVPQPHHLAGPT